MMKSILVFVFCILSSSVFAKVQSVQGKSLVEASVFAVEAYAESWNQGEGWGDIWVAPYYGKYGQPRDWSFRVVKTLDRDKNGKPDFLYLQVQFPCGSEYDESEHPGECSVKAYKNQGRVIAKASRCLCGSP